MGVEGTNKGKLFADQWQRLFIRRKNPKFIACFLYTVGYSLSIENYFLTFHLRWEN